MDQIYLPIASLVTTVFEKLAGSTDGKNSSLPSVAVKKALAPNPLSYPQSSKPYSGELFKNPTSEYRGCPFWAWNNKLNKEQLLRQVDIFSEMGMGGFHMHSRTGLDVEYLGPEFMDMVNTCVEAAAEKGLLACLYDEDRWPSGTAGGKVIQDNPEFKKKKMKFTPNFYDGDLLAAYIVDIDESGYLRSYRILKEAETDIFRQSQANLWFAFVETDGPDPWFNGQTYVDTLNKDAMAYFIKLTYEKYKSKIGNHFGTTVPCIFTDEPQFTIMNQLDSPTGRNDVFFAWTADFLTAYEEKYSSSLLDHLPELVWTFPRGRPSSVKVRYRDFSCEMFVSAFMDQLATWCGDNNLYLNGHMMEEPTLRQQTCALGEAMRCYRKMQMPGMDLLCDWTEYNTAKQVSSVARQNGLRGAMSELYGVTHWDFTFEGHKGSGDWQAALGITMRVHHLAWVSMAGESKRDYPASIGYQSTWYKEYGYVEGHFARIGVAMTRGSAVTRVAVVHPIESYWLSFGPRGDDEMDMREQAFDDLTNWLLHGLIDFDFISESLLPDQCHGKGTKGKLTVGACEYDVVVLPNLKTIRSTTLKILQDFSKGGGRVIVAGSTPRFVDASIPLAKPTFSKATSVMWSQQSILSSLEEFRDINFVRDIEAPAADFLYQMRADGKHRFVFICNRNRNSAVPGMLIFKGHWALTKMDTLSGEEIKMDASVKERWTCIRYQFEGCASLLLRLSPAEANSNRSPELIVSRHGFLNDVGNIETITCSPLIAHNGLKTSSNSCSVTLNGTTLSEPNVLLFDYAEFKLDAEESWTPQEEVLRIENIIRGRLGLFQRGDNIRQPWVFSEKDREPLARVTLRFTFKSDFTVPEQCLLALEDVDKATIHVNDIAIPVATLMDYASRAWWVDQDIKTVPIPAYVIHQGINTLTLSMDFGVLTSLERIYLLGNFSVALDGHATCVRPPQPIIICGDIVPQGYPFYVGNITYKYSFEVSSTPSTTDTKIKCILTVPDFSSPVLAVTDSMTGNKIGNIAFEPHTLDMGELEEGTHEIEITAFGNRYNSFGHLHAPLSMSKSYCGPGAWRTAGNMWTDDYAVKPVGILSPPHVTMIQVQNYGRGGEIERSGRDSEEWVNVQS